MDLASESLGVLPAVIKKDGKRAFDTLQNHLLAFASSSTVIVIEVYKFERFLIVLQARQ